MCVVDAHSASTWPLNTLRHSWKYKNIILLCLICGFQLILRIVGLFVKEQLSTNRFNFPSRMVQNGYDEWSAPNSRSGPRRGSSRRFPRPASRMGGGWPAPFPASSTPARRLVLGAFDASSRVPCNTATLAIIIIIIIIKAMRLTWYKCKSTARPRYNTRG